jgi:hypothetical protein
VSLNTVTLTLDAYAGDGDPITQGTAFLVPSELLVDTTDHKTVFQTPVTVALEPPEDASEGWLPTVELFSCDSSNLSPSGWLWEISFEGMSGAPAPYSFALDYSNGADQYLSAQTPVAAAPSSPTQYLPQPTGSQLLGFVPVSLGGSAESEWFPGPGLPPSGDPTGASDTVNIQNLLNLTGQAQLQYGVFEVNGPFVPPSGKQLWVRGYKGGTQSGAGAGNNIGTVVKAVAGWTGTGLPVTAMFSVLYGNGTTNTAINEALDLRDLWIDLSAGPANVDAIASWGAMHGLVMQNLGINAPTGNGINLQKNSNFTSSNFGTGVKADTIVIQNGAGVGVINNNTDGTWVNVHPQGCALGGWQVKAANNRHIGCRADLSGFVNGVPSGNHAPGVLIDSPGPGGGYLDANTFIGFGTQRNDGPAFLITNSSTSGTSPRNPVIIRGASLDGDWVNGGAGAAGKGAVQVQGRNIVVIDGDVLVHTEDVAAGCPDYALNTETIGTAPGAPLVISWDGGHVNAMVGDFLDSANVGALLLVSPLVTEEIGAQGGSAVSLQYNAKLPVNRLVWGASGVTDVTLQRTAAGQLQLVSTSSVSPRLQISSVFSNASQPLIQLINNASGDLAFTGQVSGDSSSRYRMDSNGQMKWGPGTATQDCELSRLAANILGTTTTHLAVDSAGYGLQVKEGTNAKQGVATLTAGTVVVANTSVTANSRIHLTAQDNNSTGALRVSARTPATSFTITSSNAGDTGVVAYEIFEPAP